MGVLQVFLSLAVFNIFTFEILNKLSSISVYFFNGYIVSRKAQYKDVKRRTIEIPQRGRIFMANCCLKVHNAQLKLVSPVSG